MRLAYFRVSTKDQTIESQRLAMGDAFDREFSDEGVSGSIPAAERPGFSRLLDLARPGDVVHVYAIDRLGRDALDIQLTVRRLTKLGIGIDVRGIGQIGGGVAELVLALLAQLADMERAKIRERSEAGRAVARASLKATGRTQHGKLSLGRPFAADWREVTTWKTANGASINATAKHFKLARATIRRYCASMRDATA